MSQKVQLVIDMNENGQVSVSGPINNKMLCYGLLGVAHDAIKDFNDQAAKDSGISIARPGDLPDASRDHRLSLEAPLSRR